MTRMVRHCMQAFALGGLLVALNATASPSVVTGEATTNPTHVSLEGQQLSLEQHEQGCVLRKPDQSILPLEIPAPCYFAIGRDENARVERFNTASIVIVQHVVPVIATRECLTLWRAIRLYKGQLETSIVAQGGVACSRYGGDQKRYVGLFTWW